MGASHVSTPPRNRRRRRDEEQTFPPGSSLPKSCSHLECQISCSRIFEGQATPVFRSRSRKQFVSHSLHLSTSFHRSSYSVGAAHHCRRVVRNEMQSSKTVSPRQNFSVFFGVAFVVVVDLLADSDNMRDQKLPPMSPELRTSTCNCLVPLCKVKIDDFAGNAILTPSRYPCQ